ncbi:hypothetical protein [Gulosibacter faecalis]|uniref:O-antigen/teichoic acid export membrane protein n=1 Tax=Gulosibacter faecalis TaxID=272240 RepID=A0ABW5V3R5_9MICO|nr:hypothetical protein [Gulosibacter faecalis]
MNGVSVITKNRRAVGLATVTALNAFAGLAPQVSALLTMNAAEFGRFSLIYFAYALCLSLSLSLISEPWHIRVLAGRGAAWLPYASATAGLALLAGAAAFVLGLVLGLSLGIAVLAGLAIGLATFWEPTRYFLLQRDLVSRAGYADVAYAIVFVGAGVVTLVVTGDPTFAVYLAWAAAGVMLLGFLPASEGRLASPLAWFRDHGREARRLASDSILMDIGSICTPIFLAPMLGVAGFGTYRAVSNVAVPVRLILNPLRPVITNTRDARWATGNRRWWGVVGLGVVVALAVLLVLEAIGWLGLEIGVLNSLLPFTVPVAVTVLANFVGHYAYIRCRSRATTGELLTGRISQTLIVTLIPIAGVMLGGLAGGIWAYAISGVGTAIVWSLIDRRRHAPEPV